MRITGSVILSVIYLLSAWGQNQAIETSYQIKQTENPIFLDGVLEEKAWISADIGRNFYQWYPTDSKPAQDSTLFRITYDSKNVYIGIVCYDNLVGDFITTTLRRDFGYDQNDNVAVYIDPYNDRTNAFSFQVTPDNVQREGLVLLDGRVQDDWDNKWFSEVFHGDGFWSVEMAIPFKSIRYNNVSEWNIQVLRNNQKRNERTSWIRVPQGYSPSNMNFSGTIDWDNPPEPAGPNISLIPYIAGRTGRNHEEGESRETSGDVGFDAKVAVSSSLNLDLTFNPDFSQVEVDQQVTNLQRFEIFFPERRQFFLENQDLFAEGGFPNTRPFFSRRIGIQGSGESRRNVPIISGARLSGKIGSKWRIGLLDMVTNEDKTSTDISPAQNYSVVKIERQVFERSRISAIFVGRTNLGQVALDSFRVENNSVLNRQGQVINPNDTLYSLSAYNYVYGLDYDLASKDNRWIGDFYYHQSVDPEKEDNKYSTGAFLRYQTPKFGWRTNFTRIGENHNAEVGFVPRTGITTYGVGTNWNWFSEGKIQRHGPALNFGGVTDNELNQLDNDASFEYGLSFLNTSYMEVSTNWNLVTLTRSFDPSGSEGQELSVDTDYSWYRYRFFYRSDRRKNFIYSLDVSNGGFYNGRLFSLGSGITYRLPPVLQVQMNFNYNRVDLPDPYNDSDLILIGPRIDLTLTNKVFFTTFVQYNTQDENLGHNSRFQWRFKPVSDLFIVYTDNYLTDGFVTRNRALVIKLNYWLNL